MCIRVTLVAPRTREVQELAFLPIDKDKKEISDYSDLSWGEYHCA